MSRSYWLPIVAVVGLALAGATNAQAISHNGGRHTRAHQAQTKPKTDAQPSALIAVQNDIQRVARALEAANDKQPSPAEQQQASDNLEAQQGMVKWARWMFCAAVLEALITASGVWLVYRTLYHTRIASKAARDAVVEAGRAADAANTSIEVTREIGQKQVRAYLHCIEAKYMLVNDGIWCWPIVKNTGQSPAKNVRLDANARVWIVHADGTTNLDVSNPRGGGVPPVPAGGTENGMLMFDNPIKLGDGTGERERLNPAFDIRGLLTWEDVFGVQDSIGFTLMKIGNSEYTDHNGSPTATGVLRVLHNTPLTEAELHENDDMYEEENAP
jgi:hypothetical protein